MRTYFSAKPSANVSHDALVKHFESLGCSHEGTTEDRATAYFSTQADPLKAIREVQNETQIIMKIDSVFGPYFEAFAKEKCIWESTCAVLADGTYEVELNTSRDQVHKLQEQWPQFVAKKSEGTAAELRKL